MIAAYRLLALAEVSTSLRGLPIQTGATARIQTLGLLLTC